MLKCVQIKAAVVCIAAMSLEFWGGGAHQATVQGYSLGWAATQYLQDRFYA